MKHSSLPWVVLKGMTGAKIHFGRDLDCGDDESLGSCCYQGSRPYDAHLRDQEEANAAFIVKAVNNYERLVKNNDQLLEALKDLMESISGGKKECGHNFTCVCSWDKAMDAVKQAEES